MTSDEYVNTDDWPARSQANPPTMQAMIIFKQEGECANYPGKEGLVALPPIHDARTA